MRVRCSPRADSITRRSKWSRPAAPPTVGAKPSESETQGGPGGRVAVVEEIEAALHLVGLADGVGGLGERGDAAQEPAVGFMAVGHRSETLPSVAAQLIQA